MYSLHLLARPVAVRLPVAPLEVRHDPLRGGHVRPLAPHPVAVRDVQLVPVRAVQEEVLLGLAELLPRCLDVDLVALGDRLRDLLVVAGGAARPRQDRALVERQRRVRHHELGVDLHLGAEARAARARAVRELNENDRGSSSGIEMPQCRQANCSLYVVVSTGPPSRGTVSISTMPSASATAVSTLSASRLRRSRRITSRSTTTEMSCLNFLSRTMSSSSRRSSPSTFTRVKPSLRSSASCLPYSPLRPRTIGAMTMNRSPSSVAMIWSMICSADCAAIGRPQLKQCGLPIRAQQAQVVVDLRDGPDRRPRVARRRLLVDRDRRRQALDRVDVRLVHLPEELARVGRQRLDVPACPSA